GQLDSEVDLGRTGKPDLERWMRERASPHYQWPNPRQHIERIPPLLQTTPRALDNIAQWEHHPRTHRKDALALRLLGAALIALGAGTLGADPNTWAQTQPIYWLSLAAGRSEEHTSELQSRENLVCRLLLEKKNIY